jgi:hypothetical protein
MRPGASGASNACKTRTATAAEFAIVISSA